MGRLPLVPMGSVGSILFEMRRQTAVLHGAAYDKAQGAGDGCRWWYVNSLGNEAIVQQFITYPFFLTLLHGDFMVVGSR
jgi:hypothetical protein